MTTPTAREDPSMASHASPTVELLVEIYKRLIISLDNGKEVNLQGLALQNLQSLALHYHQEWQAFDKLLKLGRSLPQATSLLESNVLELHIVPKGPLAKVQQHWAHCALLPSIPLAKLTYLSISDIDWYNRPLLRISLPSPLQHFTRLPKLSISHCLFGNAFDLDSLLYGFPQLCELTLAQTSFERLMSPEPSRTKTKLPGLTHLNLIQDEGDVIHLLSRWIVTWESVKNITHLQWWTSDSTPGTSNALNSLVQAMTSLESLDCKLAQSQQVDLGPLVNLRTLKLSSDSFEDIADLATQILPQLSSGLQELELSVNALPSPAVSLNDALIDVDLVFASPQFACLRNARISLVFPETYRVLEGGDKKMMEYRFKTILASRGILSIDAALEGKSDENTGTPGNQIQDADVLVPVVGKIRDLHLTSKSLSPPHAPA